MELADHPQRQGFAIQLSTEKDSIKHPISQLNLFPIWDQYSTTWHIAEKVYFMHKMLRNLVTKQ